MKISIGLNVYYVTEHGGVYKNGKGWRSFPNKQQAIDYLQSLKKELN
jgi:hypothetical protein